MPERRETVTIFRCDAAVKACGQSVKMANRQLEIPSGVLHQSSTFSSHFKGHIYGNTDFVVLLYDWIELMLPMLFIILWCLIGNLEEIV